MTKNSQLQKPFAYKDHKIEMKVVVFLQTEARKSFLFKDRNVMVTV